MAGPAPIGQGMNPAFHDAPSAAALPTVHQSWTSRSGRRLGGRGFPREAVSTRMQRRDSGVSAGLHRAESTPAAEMPEGMQAITPQGVQGGGTSDLHGP